MSSASIVSIINLKFEIFVFNLSMRVSPAKDKEAITIANKSKVVVSRPNSSNRNL
jgi:hypothetical protein